jgi:GNAT superfamily N-acetyltransferase
MQARCFQTLNLFELCIDSARRRTLPDKVFGSWLPWIYEFANEPGFQELWSEIRTNYVPGCREVIDAALENPENRFIEKICTLRTHGILKKYHLRFAEWKKDGAEEAQQSGTTAAHEKNEIAIQKGSIANIEQYLAIFDEAKHDGYISHGEVYCGRATHDLKWADNIIEQMEKEFNEYLNDTDKFIVFEIRHTAALLGFAIIEVNRETQAAILQDIMITKNRQGTGIGTAALGKIEDFLQKENMGILLLESGIHNTTVHKFFEKNGYQKVSVEYAKVLD